MKRKKEKPKKKRYNFKNAISVIVFGFLITKYVLISLYDNTRLGWYGKPTVAVISPKEYKGARRHGPGKFYYNFSVGGKKYIGSTEKASGISIGDTISIFYLESDPNINCSYKYAKGIFFQKLVE